MNTFIFILVFLFGNIIGSFLNVVIYRFNSGRTFGGRSICLHCNHQLSWYELIPIFSFLIQSGRCRKCSSSISHQYPIVEIVTGLIFAMLAFRFEPLLNISTLHFVSVLSFYMFIFSILIVMTVYDIKHKIIPDRLVYTFAIISFLALFINFLPLGPLFIKPTLLAISAGPLLAIPFALIWLFSKGRLMGLGDAKLILGLGFMLGLEKGLVALIISFWIGAIFSLLLMFFSKIKTNMKTEIPFAPFLILGILIVFLSGINLLDLALLFSF